MPGLVGNDHLRLNGDRLARRHVVGQFREYRAAVWVGQLLPVLEKVIAEGHLLRSLGRPGNRTRVSDHHRETDYPGLGRAGSGASLFSHCTLYTIPRPNPHLFGNFDLLPLLCNPVASPRFTQPSPAGGSRARLRLNIRLALHPPLRLEPAQPLRSSDSRAATQRENLR